MREIDKIRARKRAEIEVLLADLVEAQDALWAKLAKLPRHLGARGSDRVPADKLSWLRR
jgi:hypothetical protein